MGEDGSSALKNAAPVPFDLATTNRLRTGCASISGPINLEHMPTHALRKGKGAVLSPLYGHGPYR
jgi:hypothetical protein